MSEITSKQRGAVKEAWMEIFEILLNINQALMNNDLTALDKHYVQLDLHWPYLTMALDDIFDSRSES